MWLGDYFADFGGLRPPLDRTTNIVGLVLPCTALCVIVAAGFGVVPSFFWTSALALSDFFEGHLKAYAAFVAYSRSYESRASLEFNEFVLITVYATIFANFCVQIFWIPFARLDKAAFDETARRFSTRFYLPWLTPMALAAIVTVVALGFVYLEIDLYGMLPPASDRNWHRRSANPIFLAIGAIFFQWAAGRGVTIFTLYFLAGRRR